MKNLEAIVVAVCTGFGAVACAGNTVIDELESIKSQICKCKDQGCVDALEKTSKTLEGKLKSLSADEQEKALAIAVDIMDCANKISENP